MPHPNAILKIIPPRNIENLINSKSYNCLNVYVDFKNACNSLFIEDVVNELVYNTNSTGNLDTSIFQSTLFFSSYWKQFAYYYKIPNCNIFFSYDVGDSYYHLNIDEEYKKNRKISCTTTPEFFEDMFKIRNQNCLVAEKICNRIPNVYFFILKHMESDFLPYYLQTRHFNDSDTFNVICSNDKDLLQNIRGNNNVMVYKNKGDSFMVTEDSVLLKYTNLHKYSNKNIMSKSRKLSQIDLDYLSAMMAIIGDSGDDVKGVNKIGPMKIIDMFCDEKHKIYLGSFEELCDRVSSGGCYFRDNLDISSMDTNWKLAYNNKDIVTKALKMISFECLIKYLETSVKDNAVNNKNYIYKILNKNNFNLIEDPKILLEGLSSIQDLYLTENEALNLF